MLSENHPAESTSGNSRIKPDLRGHSIAKVLLRSSVGSRSPSNAQARTIFPAVCSISPRSMKSPSTPRPISSRNSRLAAASGSSLSKYSPFGIDQAPASFFAQYGPPGWTSRTSNPEATRRNKRIPALRFFMRLSRTLFRTPPLRLRPSPIPVRRRDSGFPQSNSRPTGAAHR